MHFITKGTVDVVSEDGETVYETLMEGDYFGEMSCLCGIPSLVSFKYVQLYNIAIRICTKCLMAVCKVVWLEVVQ